MVVLNVASTWLYTELALIVNFKWNACKKWTSSLKSVVILSAVSLHWKEYLNTVTYNIPVNILVYRTLFCVNIYESYKLSKNSPVFWPTLYVGGLIFYQAFFSFFRQLISELAERNSTIFGHMVGSKRNLKMHVRNLGYIPSPYKPGAKNHFFGRLRNSTATLTAYIFLTKHDINNRTSAL